ncbi:hypothetical protein BC835DRAFT_598129 [Cytidiella melzeri]|nr:hypothetical protein BC835DRAFT_598129 [Cytidiella melzeri]
MSKVEEKMTLPVPSVHSILVDHRTVRESRTMTRLQLAIVLTFDVLCGGKNSGSSYPCSSISQLSLHV